MSDTFDEDWDEWTPMFKRDHVQCVYCGLDGSRDTASFWQLSRQRDHLLPRCLGGDDSLANLVTTCVPCNLRKGAFDPRDKLPDGSRDKNTTRERMIENVRARLQGSLSYTEDGRQRALAAVREIEELLAH